jgi:nitroreductase/NAD-dependent dihydropyrimidine dehydrogenase PreA subunit
METPVQIDKDRCTGCGICSRVCIFSVLSWDNSKTIPRVIPERKGQCVRCGHCETFCPSSAISVNYPAAWPMPDQPTPGPVTSAQIRDLIQGRRSVRQFRHQPVPRETIESMLDIVRYAPSAVNLQPVHWQVIEKETSRKALAAGVVRWLDEASRNGWYRELDAFLPELIRKWDEGTDLITHDAPCIIIAHTPRTSPAFYTDAVIALSYLDIVAPVFGIGTCWAGLVRKACENSAEVQKLTGIPGDHVIQHAMLAGYPALQHRQVPRRQPARIGWK